VYFDEEESVKVGFLADGGDFFVVMVVAVLKTFLFLVAGLSL
jgi:hypothetical protein